MTRIAFDDEACPNRGPLLNHTMSGHPGDPCRECGTPTAPARLRGQRGLITLAPVFPPTVFVPPSDREIAAMIGREWSR